MKLSLRNYEKSFQVYDAKGPYALKIQKSYFIFRAARKDSFVSKVYWVSFIHLFFF